MTSKPIHQYVSTGDLPAIDRVAALVNEAHARFRSNDAGTVADYIPALAAVPRELFGIAVVSTRGNVTAAGDAEREFSIQSVSKPFVFALVCQEIGEDAARDKLGVNSTGLPFNSILAIEHTAAGTTNPMVNAGAIAAASLAPGETADAKWRFIRDGLSRFAGARSNWIKKFTNRRRPQIAATNRSRRCSPDSTRFFSTRSRRRTSIRGNVR